MLQKNAVINSSSGTYHAFNANIIQDDPCVPNGQVDLFSRGVHELVTARGGHPSQGMGMEFLNFDDPKLMTVLGCNNSKIRFVSQAQYGKTDQEIRDMISSSPVLDTTVILKGDSGQQPLVGQIPDFSPMTYRPTFFNANRLDLDVTVKLGFSGWLVFADAIDPHWKAYVNGKEKPVMAAYRAFKAITIEGGDSKVSFRYENTWQKYAMGLLTVVGILLAAGCFVGLGWQLFNGRGAGLSHISCSRSD